MTTRGKSDAFPELARLTVKIHNEAWLNRVEWVEGSGKLLPVTKMVVHQGMDPHHENVLVLHIPLRFVDLEQQKP